MSWPALAWAVKQKTGSPHSKLLLLLLANRADDDGICWPSQINLADQSEQSADTVQRHLRNLEGRFIRRARNRRTRGRWPGFVYQLLMPGVVDGDLQKKPAQKRAVRRFLAACADPQTAACTEPQPAASPSRSQRPHRAAPGGVESSDESSVESSTTESSRVITAGLAPEKPMAVPGKKENREDLVHARIAHRLGADGWGILQAMNPHQLAQIVSLERLGHLDDRDLNNIRCEAKLSGTNAEQNQ
jgi:Helix-turn-helix domain